MAIPITDPRDRRAMAKCYRAVARASIEQANEYDPDGREVCLLELPMKKGQLAEDVPAIRKIIQELLDANAALATTKDTHAADLQTANATIVQLQAQLAAEKAVTAQVDSTTDFAAADDLRSIVQANLSPSATNTAAAPSADTVTVNIAH